VFTEIQLHFVVTGFALAQKHVERAIALSAKKYCSASQMLVAGGVSISESFEIREAEA
jgi:putative redox protein